LKSDIASETRVDLYVIEVALNFAIGDRTIEKLHLVVGPAHIIIVRVNYRREGSTFLTKEIEFLSIALLEILHIIGNSGQRLQVTLLVIRVQNIIRQLSVP